MAWPFPVTSYPVHYSQIILQFDVMCDEVLATSSGKLQINELSTQQHFTANAYFKTRWAFTEPAVFHVTDYSVSRNGRRLDCRLPKCGRRHRRRLRICCNVFANSNSLLVRPVPPPCACLLLSSSVIIFVMNRNSFAGFITVFISAICFLSQTPKVQQLTHEDPRNVLSLTLSLLMSYIHAAPCKARNFNVVYMWTYVWQRWKPPLCICYTMFQHWINAESYPVAQLWVNTLLATKITLITDGI
jgi:hypothetical protein